LDLKRTAAINCRVQSRRPTLDDLIPPCRPPQSPRPRVAGSLRRCARRVGMESPQAHRFPSVLASHCCKAGGCKQLCRCSRTPVAPYHGVPQQWWQLFSIKDTRLCRPVGVPGHDTSYANPSRTIRRKRPAPGGLGLASWFLPALHASATRSRPALPLKFIAPLRPPRYRQQQCRMEREECNNARPTRARWPIMRGRFVQLCTRTWARRGESLTSDYALASGAELSA